MLCILIILLVGSLFFSSNATSEDLLEPLMDDDALMIENDADLNLKDNNENFQEKNNPAQV